MLTLDLKKQEHNVINQIDFLTVKLLGNNYYLCGFWIIFFIHHIFFFLLSIWFCFTTCKKKKYLWSIQFVDSSSYSWWGFWKSACWAWDCLSQLEEGEMPQPFSLSLTVQLVDCATELINTYLMLCTLHSGLSSVWAWGASWWFGRFPLCSHVSLSAFLFEKRY